MTESELHFCTPLSSSMMQAGVCLKQDTETTLPELTEQHRIRPKEEELSGLESVHMAESETECAAPGLNTLEPECVTAHSGVSDVHHTNTSLIKTETDLGTAYIGDFIKTESLDRAELGCVTHLHPDQIKTETDDGGYVKVEHISELQDIKYVHFKSEKIKSEYLVSDVMNTVMNGGAVGEPNQNCKNEEMTQCGVLDHNCDINNENTQPRIVLQKSTNRTETEVAATTSNVQILNKGPKSHNLDEGNNTSGTIAETFLDACKGCQKPFQSLPAHLRRSKQCQLHYDMKSLHKQVIVKHAGQKTIWIAAGRQTLQKHKQTEATVGLNHVEQPLLYQKEKESTPIEVSEIRMKVTRKRAIQGNCVDVIGKSVSLCNVNINAERDCPRTNETICKQAKENQKRTEVAATTSNVQILNKGPKSHNLDEGNNTSGTIAITFLDACKGCQKPFQRLLAHLSRSKQCQLHYNMKSLHQQAIVKRSHQKKCRRLDNVNETE